jgi:hypothetical protein
MIKIFASNKILKKFGQQFIETFCYMLVRFFKPTGHHSLGFCALCEPLVHFALKKTETNTHRWITIVDGNITYSQPTIRCKQTD